MRNKKKISFLYTKSKYKAYLVQNVKLQKSYILSVNIKEKVIMLKLIFRLLRYSEILRF